MEDQIILSIKDLKTYFYNTQYRTIAKAVDGISMNALRGKITAVVGKSGSGKSVMALSLFKLIEEPGRIENGEIVLNGRNISRLNKKEFQKVCGKEMTMIFQDPTSSLNPVLKIKHQLMEAIFIHEKMRSKHALGKCESVLKKVGLKNTDKILNSYPFQLSGGMCQRVMIAMAILSNPSLLIADEPTTALDLTVQAEVLEQLEKLRDLGMAIVLITHDLGVVAQTADYVYVMNRGKFVESGNVYDIFESPQHEYTKKLMEYV
ncbi:MAG: ABC transporter ATP-binding protein [Clostridium sp.]|jgi:ABC-type dipeptide/oligopeptide/nickel transport system ATPase component|uniref:ABC transporter ATP-binding protein n=1 Tax=Clostridium sp. TaxID=1506 RepID=UPI0025C5A227|nr:ABC transporter ATP-binding protein [Clostridium sp.]MCH3963769.1 ABC transporter ATP-binding protein [Clostridium sp.]MCI1714910.1 ABC transporter ATP-binding protein [Clostridium sp.]MCI1798901.1 ABC transporter ATP-binding protein [Clostridium sp.]MCI1813093.1 ABC transporter ATP-binding protein [Clostridium sp.]MCI1869983.1 ABC transporter ATP-binding protein [Clostridium sp.]